MKCFRTTLKHVLFIFTSPAMLLLFDRCRGSVEISAQTSLCACALRHVKESFHEKAFDIASKFNATIRIRPNSKEPLFGTALVNTIDKCSFYHLFHLCTFQNVRLSPPTFHSLQWGKGAPTPGERREGASGPLGQGKTRVKHDLSPQCAVYTHMILVMLKKNINSKGICLQPMHRWALR